MEQVRAERQDGLNHVEEVMTYINGIAKKLDTKVHEQRGDLVEIN